MSCPGTLPGTHVNVKVMDKIKILVPTDFSECANNALKYATHIVKELDSSLTIMHGYHIPIPAAEMTLSIDPEMTSNYQRDVEEKVEELKETIKGLDSIPSDFKFVMAFAVEAILHSIETTGTDLVIMGTKGASGVQKALFGSIASSIVQKSPKPVLTIPTQFEDFKLENIAIAVDLDSISDYHIFDLVKLLAYMNNAEVHIINVSKENHDTDQLIEVKKLEALLGEVPHHYHVIRDHNVDKGIRDYIDKKNIDLLTMVTRHHSLLDRIFRKSHTKEMSSHIHIPLLTIPE